MDEQRRINAWLLAMAVFLSLSCLGHFALLALGFDADKICCVFYGLLVLFHFGIALIAAMFGIVAGYEYAQRPAPHND